MTRLWISAGAANGFIAVALSAFASHAFGHQLTAEATRWVETGARSELAHGLALLAVAWMSRREVRPSVFIGLAGWAFLFGIILFSGSLYVMAFTGDANLDGAMPVGGVALLVGWATLFFYGWSPQSK